MRSLAILVLLCTTARADDLELAPASVTATSTLASSTNRYAAWHPFAGKADPDRMWCEGKPDEGVGEALVLAFASPVKIESIELLAGVWKSDELFRANNLVTAIDVTTDDGRKLAFAFSDKREPVEMKLGGAPVKQLRFALTKIKKGKMNDSCISAVHLKFDSHLALLAGVDKAPPLGAALAELRDALSECSEAKLGARLKFPFINKLPSGDNEKPRSKTYANLKDLMKACKKADLKGTEGTFEQPSVNTEKPGTIIFGGYPNAWKLVLEGGAWRLAGIEDNSV